jgi:hypothetical protein
MSHLKFQITAENAEFAEKIKCPSRVSCHISLAALNR